MPTRPTFAGVAGVLRAARDLPRASHKVSCAAVSSGAPVQHAGARGSLELVIEARRCVQCSFLMRLQDAIVGPSVIPSFKKPIRVFDRVLRRGHKLGTEPHPGLAQPRTSLPSSAPRVRTLPFPLPRSSAPPRAPRFLRVARAPGHKSLDSPPQRRRRGPKQQGQEKVQTGEKIRAPKPRAQEPTAFQ